MDSDETIKNYTQGIQDVELFEDSYQVFRRDHYIGQTKLGGGLLLNNN